MTSNPYLMISIRNIKRNKIRSILLIVGVALTVALQIGIAISVDSLTEDFIQGQRNRNYTDITVYSKDQTTLDTMNNLIPTIQTVEGLGKISTFATLPVINYTVGVYELPSDTIFYAISTSHPDFNEFYVLEGKRSIKAEEVIISENLARLLLLEDGDELELSAIPELGFIGATLKITAIMEEEYLFGNFEDRSFILLNIDYIQSLFEDPSVLTYSIAITIPNLIKINEISYELTDLLPGYYVIREKHIDELRATGLESYRTAMTLLVVASYIIEFLFITNILAITMRERGKEFGVMRSIGTSIKQLVILIITEISMVGVMGSILGVIFGLGLSFLLLTAFKYYLGFSSLSSLIIQPQTLFLSIITGIAVTIFSGIWPLIVAVRQPIIVNIHNLTRYKEKKRRNLFSWQTSVIIGVVLIATGLVMAYILGETRFLGFGLAGTHLLAVALIFLGALAIEAALITFIPKIGSKIMSFHPITSLLIATKNFQREMQKSIITIFTAALSLSFILLISIVSSGLVQAVPPYYIESFGENTDIVIETWDHEEFPNNFTNTLESRFYWIENTSFIQEQRSKFTIGVNIFVFGVKTSSYKHFLDEFIIEPANTSITTLMDNNSYNLIISDILAERLGGLSIGEALSLEIEPENDVEFEVTGICEGNTFIHNGEYIFLDTVIFQELWGKTESKWFMADISNEINKRDAEEYIYAAFPSLKAVKSTYYYFSMIKNSLGIQGAFIQLIFIHSFLLSGLAQFICILISTLKMEREVAVMRSVGLGRNQVIRLFLTEAGILGFTGLSLGIFNGLLGAQLAAWYISQSIPITVSIQGLRDQILFLLWLVASLLITLGSTYIPSKRAAQRNIVAAISGRHVSEGMIFIYEPLELDLQELSDKLYGPVAIAEEVKATMDAKAIEEAKITKDEEKLADADIKSLIDEIKSLLESTELTESEKEKWHNWFHNQKEKFENGELAKSKFIGVLKRYRKFLREKREELK